MGEQAPAKLTNQSETLGAETSTVQNDNAS